MKNVSFIIFLTIGLLISIIVIFMSSDSKIVKKENGIVCTDSSQCKGKCVYTTLTSVEEDRYLNWSKNFKPGDKLRVSGKCNNDNPIFGCYAIVRNGYIDNFEICVDPGPLD